MDIHNYPIDYEVAVTDARVRALLRERTVGREPGRQEKAGRSPQGWPLPLVLAEPLVVGGAGFLLGWLAS